MGVGSKGSHPSSALARCQAQVPSRHGSLIPQGRQASLRGSQGEGSPTKPLYLWGISWRFNLCPGAQDMGQPSSLCTWCSAHAIYTEWHTPPALVLASPALQSLPDNCYALPAPPPPGLQPRNLRQLERGRTLQHGEE